MVCHSDVSVDETGSNVKLQRASEIVAEAWNHLPENGLLCSLWTGGGDDGNALVALAVKKKIT